MSVHLPLKIVVSAEGGGSETASITRDVSSHGVYCFLPTQLPLGLHVEVTLAERFQSMRRRLPEKGVLARVVRSDHREGCSMSGVALRFFNEVRFFRR